MSRNFLAIQYELLRQAKIALGPGGSVVVVLGVRMPEAVVSELFALAGFGSFEALVVDVKEQSQPEVVVEAYARQERDVGVLFDFYREGVTETKLEAMPLAALKSAVEPWRISATEALTLLAAGQKIYHVVAVLCSKK